MNGNNKFETSSPNEIKPPQINSNNPPNTNSLDTNSSTGSPLQNLGTINSPALDNLPTKQPKTSNELIRNTIIVIASLVFLGSAWILPGLVNKNRAENKASEIYSNITNGDMPEKSADHCHISEQGPFGGGNKWCGRYMILSNVSVEQIRGALLGEGWSFYDNSNRHATNMFRDVRCNVYLEEDVVYMPDDVLAELGVSYSPSQPISYLFCTARS